MKRTSAQLGILAALEGATGLLLIAAPSVLARLLFAAGLDAAGTSMARLAGIALFALALACWIQRGRCRPSGFLAHAVCSMVSAEE